MIDFSGLWAITPEGAAARDQALSVVAGLMARGSRGSAEPGLDYPLDSDGRATFALRGVMVPRGPSWIQAYGFALTEPLAEAIEAAAVDESVTSGRLVVDSPGGSVFGTERLAQAVRSFASSKPFDVVSDGMIASAALWVASQASSIAVRPSDLVGSIGVISSLTDLSKAFDRAGLRVTPIRSSPAKGLVPGEEITEEQVQARQDLVDAHAKLFRAAVTRGRGLSAEQWKALGDPARLHTGAEAVRLGLADTVIDGPPSVTDAPSGAKEIAGMSDKKDAPDLAAVVADLKAQMEKQAAEHKAAMMAQGQVVDLLKEQLEAAQAREAARAQAEQNRRLAAMLEAVAPADRDRIRGIAEGLLKAGGDLGQLEALVSTLAPKVHTKPAGTTAEAPPTSPIADGPAGLFAMEGGELRVDLGALARQKGVA